MPAVTAATLAVHLGGCPPTARYRVDGVEVSELVTAVQGAAQASFHAPLAGWLAMMMAGTATTQAAITSAPVSLNARGRAE
jgi:hypothetical protein